MSQPPIRASEAARPPRATAVIPTWNRRAIVAEAIESVLAQTVADLEVVVVDDGSTDGTADMLRARYGGEARVRVIVQANGGTAAARNRGLDAARAPYVGFLDSDDLWRPTFLASQIERLEAQGADAVLGDALYENARRGCARLFEDPSWRPPTGLDAMLAGGWGLPTALLVRTAAARATRFDTDYPYSEDTEFLLRFNAAGHTLVLNPEPVAVWRGHATDRKTANTEFEHQLAGIRMLAPYARDARARRRIRFYRYAMNRQMGRQLASAGHWRAARPHLAFCARRRPHRARVLGRWLRSLLTRASSAPVPPAMARRSARVRELSR